MFHLRRPSLFNKLRLSISIFNSHNQEKYFLPNLSSLELFQTLLRRCSANKAPIQESGLKRNSVELAAFESQHTNPTKESEDKQVYIISDETVQIYFQTHDGKIIKCTAHINQRVVDVVLLHDFAMQGNCKGGLSCSTCHVILNPEDIMIFPEPSQKEFDMLEIVPYVTATSRLCCQIRVTKEMDGIMFKLPYPVY